MAAGATGNDRYVFVHHGSWRMMSATMPQYPGRGSRSRIALAIMRIATLTFLSTSSFPRCTLTIPGARRRDRLQLGTETAD